MYRLVSIKLLDQKSQSIINVFVQIGLNKIPKISQKKNGKVCQSYQIRSKSYEILGHVLNYKADNY